MMTDIYMKWKEIFGRHGFSEDMLVFGEGSPDSRVMLIGEAPGKDEVEQGRPFCGKAGKNLSEFLNVTGIKREELYITNTVKFRPFKTGPSGRKSNRPPTKEEIRLCAKCLKEEIKEIDPALIVTLGNTALRAVMGDEKLKVSELHGQMTGKVFVMYHPASVIYRRELEAVYIKDMERLAQIISGMEKG